MKTKVIVGAKYKNKVFNSMTAKLVVKVNKGIVVTSDKKYMSDEHVTYPEDRFLMDYYLVS